MSITDSAPEKPTFSLKATTPWWQKTLLYIGTILAIAIIWLAQHTYFTLSTTIGNPKATPITITLDGKEMVLPANTLTKINIWPGTHSLSFSGKTESFEKKWVNFDFLSNDRGSFLNPTHSSYPVEAIVYSNNSMNSISHLEVDGKIYESQYEGSFFSEIKGLYSEAHYLPEEASPDTVSVESSQKSVTRYKIYTKKEFIDTVASPVDTTKTNMAKFTNLKNQPYKYTY